MDKLLPHKTRSVPYYRGLNVNTPNITPSWTHLLDSECLNALIDIPSYKSTCTKLSMDISLNSLDNFSNITDLDAILVKESDLKSVTQIHLVVGDKSIVTINRHMIKDFCDKTIVLGETYVNLFSKFIDKIPSKSCFFHSIYVCFEYDKFLTDVSTVTKMDFKYDNYDDDYDFAVGYDDSAFDEVKTTVYHGWTPSLKLCPSKEPCPSLVSFLDKVEKITEPHCLGLSRYIIFEAENDIPKDIVVTVDNTSFTIPKTDLFYLHNAKQFLWKTPHNKRKGFMTVHGKSLKTSSDIAYSLHVNTLQVKQGLVEPMLIY